MPFNVTHIGHISAQNVEALLEAAKEDPKLLPSFMVPGTMDKSEEKKTKDPEDPGVFTSTAGASTVSASTDAVVTKPPSQQPVPIPRSASVSKPKPKPRPRSIAEPDQCKEPGAEGSTDALPVVPLRTKKTPLGDKKEPAQDTRPSAAPLPEPPPRVDLKVPPPVKVKPKVEPKPPLSVPLRSREQVPPPRRSSGQVTGETALDQGTGTGTGRLGTRSQSSVGEAPGKIQKRANECTAEDVFYLDSQEMLNSERLGSPTADRTERSVDGMNPTQSEALDKEPKQGPSKQGALKEGPKRLGPPPIPPRVDLH